MLRRVLRHPLTRLLLTLLLGILLGLGFERPLVRLLLRLTPTDGATLYRGTVGHLVAALLLTVALLVTARGLERKRPSDVGLGPRHLGRDLGLGFLVGGGLICAVVGLLALAGWFRLADGPPESAGEVLREALVSLSAFAWVAYAEELLFRGILFRLLEEWLGSAVALLLSSAAFGLVHAGNPDATWTSSLFISLEAGLLLGGAYMLTRSLWFAVGIHWAWNWVQGSLFGIDVSGAQMDGILEGELVGPPLWTGGAFGAEGGWVAVLLGTTAGLLVTWAASRRGQWRPFLHWRRQRRAAAARGAVSPAP